MQKLIQQAVRHPKGVMGLAILFLVLALAQFPKIQVDTDPENMLPAEAPVRVFHHETKKEFSLYDFIVLGIVNEKDPDGVFNPSTLQKIYELTEKIKKVEGVIGYEITALSTKDNIEQESLGTVRFQWLMEAPPTTREEALKIREEALSHPLFEGSVISDDGKAAAIYIPIERKDISYEVAEEVRALTESYTGDEQFYITGLPVAEDQFGVEMFKQMAVSAPLAGLIIFLLMLFFFRSAKLVTAPMIVAVMTVILTMGLLIGFKYPVHIMSSMIPIFLMPIAVLDSVHILSEFFDQYPRIKNREKTILTVIKELFTPMLFTSLTSAAGFFSLSFSPIPPVQVFGVFVATGVILAWLLTLILIPAYVMLMSEKSFYQFGLKHETHKPSLIDKVLASVRTLCTKNYAVVLVATVILIALSGYGISKIQVNDNPVRWFTAKHPIRVADKVLNEHFSGTYEAYLVLKAENQDDEVFIQPEMLRYVAKMQEELTQNEDVGKTTSLADIVKKIYDELLGGDRTNYVIPKTKAAVAQTLISFENSHKPDDLWHMVTPDYSSLNIWFQLKSGDNKDMSHVAQLVSEYLRKNPPPNPVHAEWAGLTYINVVWQNNMVGGMLRNFLGSFVIVFIMMLILFRSLIKAVISMVPLLVTILFIYSLLGFFGKDYDMPVAVLSALTLGLSVDFAIHFIQRAREINATVNGWKETAEQMFGGPGRAIVRNALVIAIGFLPLLVAPLIPYRTVGFFMFMIMAVSTVATLLIIPALISWMPNRFFKSEVKQ